MKVLIIQHKMIGDVLLSSLLCENIKKKYPYAIVDYLVNDNTLPILENNSYIDNIIVFRQKNNKNLLEIIKFSKKINKNEYDVIIDVYSKILTWIEVFFIKASKKVSFKKIGREFLYTHSVTKNKTAYSNLGLAIEHRLALLKPLGIEKPLVTNPKLYLTELEIKSAKQIFVENNINSSKKTIMISLLGSKKEKTYPLDSMAKFVNYIGENYDVNILFNYFPKQLSEAKIVYNQLLENTKSRVYFDVLANDLRAFIALVNECDLALGNEGGAINIAKAVNKKSFTIFSPYVDKGVWSTFEDGVSHVSIHLKDYFPEKFQKMTDNKIKKRIDEYYSYFNFELFKDKLKWFLDNNLNKK